VIELFADWHSNAMTHETRKRSAARTRRRQLPGVALVVSMRDRRDSAQTSGAYRRHGVTKASRNRVGASVYRLTRSRQVEPMSWRAM
jgi:hypothetical protein